MCAGIGFCDLHWEDFARLSGMELATTCHHLPLLTSVPMRFVVSNGRDPRGSGVELFSRYVFTWLFLDRGYSDALYLSTCCLNNLIPRGQTATCRITEAVGDNPRKAWQRGEDDVLLIFSV